ncbi:MAG: hypothetical protein RXS42_07565 [Nitrososphaeria archaeon]
MQRLGPILGSIGTDPRDAHRIFVDETMVSVGRTPTWIWSRSSLTCARCSTSA